MFRNAFSRRTARGAGMLLLAACALIGGCPPEQQNQLLARVDDLFGTNLAAPTLEAAAPTSGPAAGGTRITLRGKDFAPQAAVLFGDVAADAITVVNPNVIEVIAPPHAPGVVAITVSNGNNRTDTLEAAFEYLPPEPPAQRAPVALSSVSPTSGPTAGGTLVTVRGANFEPGDVAIIGGNLGLESKVVNATTMTFVTPPNGAGTVDVVVVPAEGPAVTLEDGFTYVAPPPPPPPAPEPPPSDPLKLLGAVARDNKHVVLSFSEKVGDGADDPSHYSITGSDTAFLVVTAATVSGDGRTVELTTLSQSADIYTVHVVGLQDIYGNPLAAAEGPLADPVGPDPTRARFAGIPPGSSAEQIDTDGDGFADWFEMAGWMVTVRFTNGTTSTFHVTSDPFNADTDGDGFSDAIENALSLDPRTDDTDADLVPDPVERNEWRSDPANQDSDFDGFGDYLEITQFHTSPILEDTDGDQLSDDDEVLRRNRNPRLADVPLPQIRIGAMTVQIDERFTFTDERGREQSTERSTSSTFSQSQERRFSTTSTRSMEATDKFNQEVEAGYGDGSAAGGGYLRAKVGFEQERSRGYSFEMSQESAQASQQEFSQALAEALTVSERREVTRTVEGAQVLAEVTLVNAGTLAFTISNIEISARVQDARDRSQFLPMAALLPQSGNTTFNLGPFQSQRGPFIFANSEIFPNLAQDLLREPRTILFDIANFDITDELGRNFAFTSEQINDRTAEITIDFGNGQVEVYRVAIASTFDERGVGRGITMREALTDILGLTEVTDESAQIPPELLDTPAVQNSFGTRRSETTGAQVLTRVRGVQTNMSLTVHDRRFWVVLSDEPIDPATDFGDIVLRPRAEYLLWYVQDNDDDRLFARQEAFFGSSDENPDSDGDGIGDYDEVKVGWDVVVNGERRQVFSHPGLVHSDGDGLDDLTERRLGTDPRSKDTDADGIPDGDEIHGYEVALFDGDSDPSNNPVLQVVPYSDAAVREPPAGGNGVADLTASGDDVQVIAPGAPAPAGATIIRPGPNGVIDTFVPEPSIYEPPTGGNGIADTRADPATDDIQVVPVGLHVDPGRPVIRPGPNGVIDTVPAGDELAYSGDDFLGSEGPAIVAPAGGVATTAADPNSDDEQITPVGAPVTAGQVIVRAGPDNVLQTVPAGAEIIRTEHRSLFASDPLARDSDGDTLPDGREQLLGSNPNVRDAETVVDSDFDGLTDAEETVGWLVTVIDVQGNPTTTQVTSDPADPDSDNDGLPDLLEFSLRTNPVQTDSDGDGLDDKQEYDPNDPQDYFNDDSVATFEDRCADAEDCVFQPAENPVGSNPLDADTDDDTRNDGDEVLVGWTVQVFGATPYEIFSDPLEPDADLDGLNDAAELAAGTDPEKSDTDGDDGAIAGVQGGDGYEVGIGRNPLRKDVQVVFTYTSINIIADCDPGTSGGEFEGLLKLRFPGGSEQTLFNIDGQCDSVPEGGTCNVNASRTFLMNEGESFVAFSTNIEEDDSDSGDEMLGSFSEDFPYGRTGGNLTWTLSDGSGGCEIRINATVALQ